MNFILILWYGLIGAVYALLCAEALIWIMNYYFVRREISHIPFWEHLKKPLISAVVMTVLVLILPSVHFIIM